MTLIYQIIETGVLVYYRASAGSFVFTGFGTGKYLVCTSKTHYDPSSYIRYELYSDGVITAPLVSIYSLRAVEYLI